MKTLNCFHNISNVLGRISKAKIGLNLLVVFSPNIYSFKFNNRNTTKKYEICLKLTIKTPELRRSKFAVKTPERRHWDRIWCFCCWHDFTLFYSVSIVDFERLIVYWVSTFEFGVMFFHVNLILLWIPEILKELPHYSSFLISELHVQGHNYGLLSMKSRLYRQVVKSIENRVNWALYLG